MMDASGFTRKTLIGLAIFAAALVAGTLLVAAERYFLLLFAGILIGCFWTGLARWLARKSGWGYGLTLALTITLCFSLLVAIFWYLGPAVARQLDQLIAQLPSSLSALRDKFGQYQWSQELLNMMPDGDQLVKNPEKIISRIAGFLGTAVGMLVDVVLVLVLAIFISVNPKLYHDGITLLFPERKRPRISHALNASSYTLFMWLVGRIIDMAILGLATGLGLWMLGFDLALALGILTALLCFIPNIGPVLSVIPPALIAVADPQLKVWWVVALYAGLQTLESYLLTPLIQKKAVELPPALLLIAQVVLAAMFGGLGLLLATPLVAVALVLVKMLYIEDVIGTRLAPKGELKTSP